MRVKIIVRNSDVSTLRAGTQRLNNVDLMLIQLQDVESTLNRRCYNNRHTMLKQRLFNFVSKLRACWNIHSCMHFQIIT